MERERSQRGDHVSHIDSSKLFGKWSVEGIEVENPSLKQVIVLTPVVFPHSFGRHAKKPYGKTKVNIVERLINKLMRGGTGRKLSGRIIRTHGRLQGRKMRVIKHVEKAFDLIYEREKKNPVELLVKAIENAAPREDITRVEMGGVSYQLAVDISATRSLDLALRNIALAALMKCFDNEKELYEALAEEIINAAKGDMQSSYAVRRKDEIERIAKAAR